MGLGLVGKYVSHALFCVCAFCHSVTGFVNGMNIFRIVLLRFCAHPELLMWETSHDVISAYHLNLLF